MLSLPGRSLFPKVQCCYSVLEKQAQTEKYICGKPYLANQYSSVRDILCTYFKICVHVDFSRTLMALLFICISVSFLVYIQSGLTLSHHFE